MDTRETQGAGEEARRKSVGAASSSSRSSSYELSAASSKGASKKGRSVEPDQSKTTSDKASISSHTRKSYESSAAAARRPSISTETLKFLQSSSTGHRHSHRESLGALLTADEEQFKVPSARPGSAQSFRSSRKSSVTSNPLDDVTEVKSEPGQPRPSFSSSLASIGAAIMSGIPGLNSSPASVAGSDVGDSE